MNIQETMRTAELLVHENKLEEAEEQFLLVIQKDPENKEAYNNLGFIAFSQRNTEKAIFLFKKALDIDPLYIDAIINLCNILILKDAIPEALVTLTLAIKKNPENIELNKMLEDINANIIAKRIDDKENEDCGYKKALHPKNESKKLRTLKVIHLPLIIANNATALSKYLNRLGVDSKVISYFRTWLNYRGDINLDLDGLGSADRNRKVSEFIEFFFKKEAKKYDIFHFHFFDSLATGSSFGGWKSHPERNDYWDLEYIKNMGKKIIVSSWGSDVRNNSKLVYYQLKYDNPAIKIPYPPLNRRDQYNKIWKFAQYADAIVHCECELVKHTPYGTMIPIGIDLEPFDLLLKKNIVRDKKLSILYAPSNQFYKGTNYTEAVLKRINDRFGEKIEIRKVHGLPYMEAIKRYLGNGAAIDDINFAFGLFGVEAMYLGRTVFTTFRKEEYFGDDPKLVSPIISVDNKDDFYNKLAEFMDSDYVDRSDSYRKFVRENFSSLVIANKYKILYEQIMSGEKLEQYVSQEWNKEYNSFMSKEKIDKQDYYPQVTDILLKENDFEKLLHEVQMGMGLNDDLDLLAKYILVLEITNQQDRVSAAKTANHNVVSTGAFVDRYQRAKELYYSNNPKYDKPS